MRPWRIRGEHGGPREARMLDSLISLFERPLRPRMFLVGDVMLDRYLWGDVERISQIGRAHV